MRFVQLSFLDRLTGRLRPDQKGVRSRTPAQKIPKLKTGGRKRTAHTTRRRRQIKNDPFLKDIWIQLRRDHFPDRVDLDNYTVYWSRRNQKRTLASCNLEEKRISVARELNLPKHYGWLWPLLYHEMCHAFLDYNVSRNGSRLAWHGPEFKALEALHPLTGALDDWIKSGGWETAVRSHRARMAHQQRKRALGE